MQSAKDHNLLANETIIIQNGKETKKIPTPPDPLTIIVEEEMKDIRYLGFEDETRFSGGAVGYVSYEYANQGRAQRTIT